MNSFGLFTLALVTIAIVAPCEAYPHWIDYENFDIFDEDSDDFNQKFDQLQKRFLLGLGLTKNTPGKEMFIPSNGLKKPLRLL